MMNFLLPVALGGAAGAVLRAMVGQVLAFPFATATVNVIGSFVMGLFFVLLPKSGLAQPLLMTGVLGGFTTFSAFSLDTLRLIEAGRIGGAMLYSAGSVALSLLAVWAGVLIARSLV